MIFDREEGGERDSETETDRHPCESCLQHPPRPQGLNPQLSRRGPRSNQLSHLAGQELSVSQGLFLISRKQLAIS